MPRKPRNYGGSVASDAVEALVDPATWPVLNDRFTNYAHNIGHPVAPTDPSHNPLDAITLATGGGCGCNKKNYGGSKSLKRKGGSIPANLPIGADTHGSLFKHSAEVSMNAASPNIKTFMEMNKSRYGHPPVETPATTSDDPATGGAKKPKSKSKSKKKAVTSAKKSTSATTKTAAARKTSATKPASGATKKPSSKTTTKTGAKKMATAKPKSSASASAAHKKGSRATKATGAKKASTAVKKTTTKK